MKSLLIDDCHKKKLSVRTAIRSKLVVLVFFIIIAYCNMFANIAVTTLSIKDISSHIFLAVLFTAVSITYILIVFRESIIEKSVDEMFFESLIPPIILSIAYIFYYFQIEAHMSIDIGTSNNEFIFKICSLTSFIIYYIFSLLRAIYNLKLKSKRESIASIIGNIFSLVIITIAIYDKNNDNIFLSQNGAILISLIVYFIIKICDLMDADAYKNIYANYLLNNHVKETSPLNIGIRENTDITILDYGCGNGKRLSENLGLIKNIDRNHTKIVGYDKRSTFKNGFIDTLKTLGFSSTFTSDIAQLPIKDFDIIIFSHVIYEQRTVSDIIAFLNKCEPGTKIFIRGASPNSFFVTSSFAASTAYFIGSTNRSHFWYSTWLREIALKSRLKRLDGTKTTLPDRIIKQDYSIDSCSAIEAAGTLISYLYSGAYARCLSRHFEDLEAYGGVTEVPNDDIIFLYQKS